MAIAMGTKLRKVLTAFGHCDKRRDREPILAVIARGIFKQIHFKLKALTFTTKIVFAFVPCDWT